MAKPKICKKKIARVLKKGFVTFGDNKSIVAYFHEDESISLQFVRPFDASFIKGLTPTEIKAGKVAPTALTRRIGGNVATEIRLSIEAAFALSAILKKAISTENPQTNL